MNNFLVAVCILASFLGQSLIQQPLSEKYLELPEPKSTSVLPVEFLKVVSLDYKNLAADLYFLKALNRFGRTLERSNSHVVGEDVEDWEWRLLLDEIRLSAALDPYFLDPYYFANAIITHHQPSISPVTQLLEEGAEARDWDWELPFYVGFNHFFFLNQPLKASNWLMEAAQRPTSKSPLLTTLAARLAHEGKQTENAIVFLKQMLQSASDEAIKTVYRDRLESLEGVFILEKAIALYKQKFQAEPIALEDLVTTQILRRLPLDPYGGIYYLDEDNNVRTSSDFRPIE